MLSMTSLKTPFSLR